MCEFWLKEAFAKYGRHLVLACVALVSPAVWATELPPRLDLIATVAVGADSLPTSVAGNMRLTGLTQASVCFYLPFMDFDYGNNRGTQRRVNRLTGDTNRVIFTGGHQAITAQSAGEMSAINDYVVQFTPALPSDYFDFQFTAKLPLPPVHTDSDWFFDGFYPQLLSECPTEVIHSDYLQHGPSLDIHFSLSFPEEYQYAGPGTANDVHASGSLLASEYVFALDRGMKKLRYAIGKAEVEVHYRQEWFLELIPTIKRLVAIYQDLLGPLPFEKLVFVESSELQRGNLPGIIAINRPKQSAFRAMLTEWTHWYHWLLAQSIASQWFGAAVSVQSPDDIWLLEGSTEFAALIALRRLPERFNLFQPNDRGRHLLSFDYLQILEISAASLRRATPFTRLTDTRLESVRSRSQQHALAYTRHALALNQAASRIGYSRFFGFMRSLIQNFRARPLTPKEFISHFGQLPSPLSRKEREIAAASITNWWKSDGWPDFALTRFDKHQAGEGQWRASVEVAQLGDVDFAPVIAVMDQDGNQSTVRADERIDNKWVASVETKAKPQYVEIDPEHEAYDTDRLNNTNRWPDVTFFPGSANTLADDGYTVIWAPYAYRNPGEPVSIAVQGALFRYIDGELFINAAVTPADGSSLYKLRHRYQSPRLGLHGDLQVDQTYEADRTTEISLVRSPVFDWSQNLSLSARLRHKQRMGQPDSMHQTVVFGVGLKPGGATDFCGFNLGAQLEASPPGWQPDFFYERRWGFAQLNCRLWTLGLGTRLFGGRVTFGGRVPESALFKPNELAESRLRLDIRGLQRVEELVAISNDIQFPLVIPLPDDSFVLSRRIKGRIFYDRGRAIKPWIEYRASGVGFSIPFGGDISGAGSLSFTSLTVLGVLYTASGDEVSRQPRIVFDLSGQL